MSKWAGEFMKKDYYEINKLKKVFITAVKFKTSDARYKLKWKRHKKTQTYNSEGTDYYFIVMKGREVYNLIITELWNPQAKIEFEFYNLRNAKLVAELINNG